MKKGSILALIIVVLLIIGGISIWGTHVDAKMVEEKINAQYIANQSNYDNMWKTFKEMAQVTELQASQMKDVYMGLISGRYDDSELLFKMVTEDNPEISTEVYTKLQNQIVAGRKEFDNNQKKIADMVREYNSILIKHPIMTFITGKKKMDANKFVITSERTSEAFNTRKDEEINLLGK